MSSPKRGGYYQAYVTPSRPTPSNIRLGSYTAVTVYAVECQKDPDPIWYTLTTSPAVSTGDRPGLRKALEAIEKFLQTWMRVDNLADHRFRITER